jgi:hypothetical protein
MIMDGRLMLHLPLINACLLLHSVCLAAVKGLRDPVARSLFKRNDKQPLQAAIRLCPGDKQPTAAG